MLCNINGLRHPFMQECPQRHTTGHDYVWMNALVAFEPHVQPKYKLVDRKSVV